MLILAAQVGILLLIKILMKTYQKDPYSKKTLDEYAYINDNTALPNINYGIVNQTDNDRCPFLDRDDLCNVQKRSGEGGLSNVCALYPRYYNVLDGVYEESLSLDCIEATEKLLFGDPLEIIEVDRPPKRDVVMRNIETQIDDNGVSGIKYINDFRKLIFGLIRNESYTFDEKLGFLMTLHEYIEEMDEDELKAALESYEFTSMKTTIGIDERIYKKIIDFLKNYGSSEHMELDSLICECIKSSNYDELKLDELSSIDRVMSNYLMHQMFKELYPFITMHNKMDSFLYLLKKVQILRLLIVYDGDFDDKRIARIIQMYSKGLDHHAGFRYELDDLIF